MWKLKTLFNFLLTITVLIFEKEVYVHEITSM